jgi:hypothetical protein
MIRRSSGAITGLRWTSGGASPACGARGAQGHQGLPMIAREDEGDEAGPVEG